jgi:hypothetical protein
MLSDQGEARARIALSPRRIGYRLSDLEARLNAQAERARRESERCAR